MADEKFNKVAYNNSFIAKTYDRINFTVPKGMKAEIKKQADKNGESVNGFIFRAVTELSEQERIHRAYLRSVLRTLEAQKEALASQDYARAERLLDELIEDTTKGIG